MNEDLLLLFGTLLATCATAWFNIAESVFLTLEPLRLPGRLKRGDYGSDRIVYFLKRPERYLTTTLTGANFSGVIFSSLSALYLEHQGVPDYLILIATTLFMLVIGETIPKAISRQTAEPIAPIVAVGLYFTRFSFWPILKLVEYSVFQLQRLFHLPDATSGLLFSRSDIVDAVNVAHRVGGVSSGEATLIHRLLKLQGRTVGELMTPRVRVATISISSTPSEAIAMARETGYKRLICVGDNPDDIRGVIHSIDLLRGAVDLSDVIRPLPMAPESLPVEKLTGWLRKNQTHFTGVLDEHGGFAGVVSLEDLAEELVGPIDDVEKPSRAECVRITSRLWLVRGRTRLSHMSGVIGFEPMDVKSATVAGWISELAEGIPEEGEEFLSAGAVIRVIKANPRGALLVRITLPKQNAAEEIA